MLPSSKRRNLKDTNDWLQFLKVKNCTELSTPIPVWFVGSNQCHMTVRHGINFVKFLSDSLLYDMSINFNLVADFEIIKLRFKIAWRKRFWQNILKKFGKLQAIVMLGNGKFSIFVSTFWSWIDIILFCLVILWCLLESDTKR